MRQNFVDGYAGEIRLCLKPSGTLLQASMSSAWFAGTGDHQIGANPESPGEMSSAMTLYMTMGLTHSGCYASPYSLNKDQKHQILYDLTAYQRV